MRATRRAGPLMRWVRGASAVETDPGNRAVLRYPNVVAVRGLRGQKTGLAAGAITCDFVSRWEMYSESILGPVTMVRVSR